MGPGCFHPRNVTFGVTSNQHVFGFNGAGMFPSQKCAFQLGAEVGGLGASMGPGCFHPRNESALKVTSQSFLASMGPGCFHPRNGVTPCRRSTPYWPQWGRDVSIPEIPIPISRPFSQSCFNGAGMFPSQKWVRFGFVVVIRPALQWGRDVSIPEISSGFPLRPVWTRASMGPGCFHPRNQYARAIMALMHVASMGPGCFHPRNASTDVVDITANALQWGRDVSIPEMRYGR